jgi:hypothetical protein
MTKSNLCPVCGFQMDAPPSDYNICSSCGTEFGHDYSAADIPALRAAWFANGPSWWSQHNPPPLDWSGMRQFVSAMMVNVPAGVPQAVITYTPTFTRTLASRS